MAAHEPGGPASDSPSPSSYWPEARIATAEGAMAIANRQSVARADIVGQLA
jgi:hypothetical protein